MTMVTDIGPRLGIAPTCRAFGLPRATYYRRRQPPRARSPRRPSPQALRAEEQTAVLAVLHEPRFVDLAPTEVYVTLLDEGRYVCSERTLKYRPAFPERFGSIQDARAHGQDFFAWYNTEHRHSGLGLLTPRDVHHGLAEQRIAARATVLAAAYEAHSERFPRGLPRPPACPQEVWINRPGMPVTEEASSVIACDAAVSFRAESAILDPRGNHPLRSAHSFQVAKLVGLPQLEAAV